jgi:hypothetical protein
MITKSRIRIASAIPLCLTASNITQYLKTFSTHFQGNFCDGLIFGNVHTTGMKYFSFLEGLIHRVNRSKNFIILLISFLTKRYTKHRTQQQTYATSLGLATFIEMFYTKRLHLFKEKGKDIPVTVREGPQGCEMSKLPIFSRQSAHRWW